MDKKEAWKVLGMNENSLRTDLEIRYATLIKRYRAEQNNEKLEEISLAYNVLTDRYVPPVEIPEKMKKVYLGKSRGEWSNIWLYNKYKFLAIVIGVIALVYFVYTVATNKPGDIKIAVVGDFYIPDSNILREYVLDSFEEFEKVDISSAFLASPQPGNLAVDTAGEQKAMILMTVSGEDVIIADKKTFARYAPMGAFEDISSLYEEILSYPQAKDLDILPATAVLEDDEKDEDDESLSDEDKKDKINKRDEKDEGVSRIYGIDLTESELLNGLRVIGKEYILTISVKSKNPERAREFIRKLIVDSPEILPLVTPYATVTPFPTVTQPPEAQNSQNP